MYREREKYKTTDEGCNVFCFIGNVGYGTLTPILGVLFAKAKPSKVLSSFNFIL